ncbi:MAG: hypothetical protein NVSMB17_11240 [Candidatus Dormibacteria bacterium]
MTWLRLLGYVVDLGFIGVGAASVVTWLRRPNPTNRHLAIALGSLGMTGLVGFRNGVTLGPWFALTLSEASEALFMLSAYALFRYRASLIPISAKTGSYAALAAVIAVVTVGVLSIANALSHLDGLRTAASLASLAYLATWCFCVGEPILSFWRLAPRRTAVQRARLRALCLGYTGMAAVLMLAVASSFAGTGGAHGTLRLGITLAVDVLALMSLPMLYVSLVPPAWLRRAWRRTEEAEMRVAYRELVRFAPDKQTVAARALNWAVRAMGADAGVITDSSGAALAVTGVPADAADKVNRDSALGSRWTSHHASLPLDDGEGAMIIQGGPFTPLLGREEIAALADYCATVAMAIDRVGVSQSLAAQIRDNETLLAAISDMGEGVVVAEGPKFVFANEAYTRMVGYSVDELRAMPTLLSLVVPGSQQTLARRGARLKQGAQFPAHYDSGLIRKDGTIIDVEIGIKDLPGTDPPRTMSIIRDIRERKRTEAQLALLAHTDSLTGVANRHGWDDLLAGALARARRDGAPLCLAMLDVDRFKAFNDDWGHQHADRLLVEMVAAWRRTVREVDTLVRYGGDEFAMLLPDCDLDAAGEVVRRIRDSVPERQKVSVGLARWNGTEPAEDLVRRADAALYQAKRRHTGFQVAPDDDSGHAAVSWSQRLIGLVQEGALESVYQPIVALDSGMVIGYEALARPTGASADLEVEELFAAAHRLGYARDLDWLGRRAAVQGAHSIADELVFINVGLWSLLDPLHDVDQMELLMRWTRRSPHTVVFEMSEREIISDVGRLREVLATYRAVGFRFALDDVGEGHSTFEVLAAADAEFIKIARSLTRRASEPGAGSAIRALATFAKSTGAQVIAEGIEDQRMTDQMRDIGVELGQGWALGRPRRLHDQPEMTRSAAGTPRG